MKRKEPKRNQKHLPRDHQEALDLIVKTKERCEAKWFLNNPSVTGVGIGYKSVGGNLTNTLSICVSVKNKSEDENEVVRPLRIPAQVVIDGEHRALLRIDDPDELEAVRAELNREDGKQLPKLKTQLQAHHLPCPETFSVKRVNPTYRIFDGENLYDLRKDEARYIYTLTATDGRQSSILGDIEEFLPNVVGEAATLFPAFRAQLPNNFPVNADATIELTDAGWRITHTDDASLTARRNSELYAIREENEQLNVYELIPTDVQTREYAFALPTHPIAAPSSEAAKGEKRWQAGIQMAGGTLGAIVTANDSTDRSEMFLTSHHVLDDFSEGARIEIDGENHRIHSIKRGGPAPSQNEVEAVTVSLKGSRKRHQYTSEVKKIGALTGTALPYLYMQLRKHGKATGLTYGVVSEFNKTVRIGDTILTNQIEIATDLVRNAKFCDAGDSGSIVVDNAQRAVGLLCALDKNTGHYAIANPIREVLKHLDVDLYLDEQEGLDKAIDDVMRDLTSAAVNQTVYLQGSYIGPGPRPLLSLGFIDDGCSRCGGC